MPKKEKRKTHTQIKGASGSGKSKLLGKLVKAARKEGKPHAVVKFKKR